MYECSNKRILKHSINKILDSLEMNFSIKTRLKKLNTLVQVKRPNNPVAFFCHLVKVPHRMKIEVTELIQNWFQKPWRLFCSNSRSIIIFLDTYCIIRQPSSCIFNNRLKLYESLILIPKINEIYFCRFVRE